MRAAVGDHGSAGVGSIFRLGISSCMCGGWGLDFVGADWIDLALDLGDPAAFLIAFTIYFSAQWVHSFSDGTE